MNWIITICLLVVLYFLWNNYNSKKQHKLCFSSTLSNWLTIKPNKEFDFFKIARYKENTPKSKTVYQYISEQTNHDLDLDDVFEYIDRTTSKIGQQYLYYKPHAIESKEPDLQVEKMIALFDENSTLRTNTILDLATLNRNETYYFEGLFNTPPTYKTDKTTIVWILNSLTIVLLVSLFFFPILSLCLVPIFIFNTVLHYKTKNAIFEYQSGVQELSKVYTVNTNFLHRTKSDAIFTNGDAIQKLKELKSTAQYLSFGKKIDHEIATILWLLVEWIKIMFNVEYLAFNALLKKLALYKDNLHQAFVNIGKIDLALTLLHIQKTENVVHPLFRDDKKIDVRNIVHPLLVDCVTNDLNLENKSLLITGSNMSGKTTFIRSFAINALLAQTLRIAFADKYEATFFKIHSFIHINDDLASNRSYYLQEVLALKQIIDESESPDANLFLLDEIMKGTNTIERIAGSTSILKHLNNTKDIVFVSTHDIELIDLLKDQQFAISHFNETIENNNLNFDYKLKHGPPNTTNAIKILELYNFPASIIMEANTIKKNVRN